MTEAMKEEAGFIESGGLSKIQDQLSGLAEAETYSHQLGFFDPEQHQVPVHIVGAGGIGSWTALALAKLGVRDITVYDFDAVEAHNQPNQLYGLDDVGQSKLESLTELIGRMANLKIKTVEGRVTKAPDWGGVVISAVDSMAARKVIWAGVQGKPYVTQFIDGRIGGEQVRVYVTDPAEDKARYEATLCDDKDVAPLPCVVSAVIDVGFFVAGMIARAVRRLQVDDYHRFETILDVRNFDIVETE